MADSNAPAPAALFDDLLALARSGWSLRFEPVDNVSRAFDLSVYISPPPDSAALLARAIYNMYNTPHKIADFVHAVRLSAIRGDPHV